MKNKERMERFLERIAKMCDEEATAMLDTDNVENAVDAIVYSSMIMNVHLLCKNIIAKSNETNK